MLSYFCNAVLQIRYFSHGWKIRKMLPKLRKSLNNPKSYRLLLLMRTLSKIFEISQAFDCISTVGLLHNVGGYLLPALPLHRNPPVSSIQKTILSHIWGGASTRRQITAEVTQGLVLGPLLYLQ